MRILHILDHSLPVHSGYAFRTAAILREQRRLGWFTQQLTTPRHGQSDRPVDEVGGFRFHRTPFRAGALSVLPGVLYVREMVATAARIVELARADPPDILHAHSPVLNALPALWAGRRLGIPVVYEVRALWEDAAVDHGVTREGALRYRISRRLETFALRHADRITTICEGLKEEIASRGIPRERIAIIANAVDTAEFPFDPPGDQALRARLGLGGKTVVGFAGSFYGYEGLDLLIEAIGMLAQTRADIRALLVGGGPQEAHLRALTKSRGLSERVIFTGRVAHEDVKRYYGLIDVLAYPRRKIRLTDIVTPLKPLEAMAQGRLLVASDVGGHRELVRDGETGFLFPADDARALGDAIVRALDQKDQWPQVRERARRFVESERNWPRSVAHYTEVYGPLCAGLPARRASSTV